MKVAIMGYGTIGSGVAEILEVNKDVIERRIGEPLELKYVLDLRKFEGDPIADKLVDDYQKIVEDEDIRIVVETMGGVEPAYTFVKAMLTSGKHVVTSNKALVADKGAELVEIARENNVNFLFEASVGGGIPIIRNISRCLTGDVIEEIDGIINGTTNYMMTKMSEDGSEFEDVLKDAQEKGFAEKDPTADIEGYDACRKIAILTSLIAGQQVDYKDVPTEGISNISAIDIKYAKEMGRAIKLLAISKAEGDSYVVRVAPYLLSDKHPLYTINGVNNAVMVHGNMLGDAMFTGSGAGKLPTASAVVADMVEAALHVDKNVSLKWEKEKLELADAKQQVNRFFCRSGAVDAEIESAFGKVTFVDAGMDDEIGFVTEPMTEEEYEKRAFALRDVKKMIRFAD